MTMRRVVTLLNELAAAFSLWWLVVHSMRGKVDWETWFAVGYLVVSAVTVVYLVRTRRGATT